MSLPVDIEEKYEVLGQLAVGGMGAVYKVRHRLLDELRVIKVMQPQHALSESSRTRFHREAMAAIRLRHPNVAQVHDFSEDRQGVAYLVMEFIDGLTLKQLLLKSSPPPLELVLEIAIQSLAALAYLHRQGYLHRDIAPDNLMLASRIDGGILVKLIDLGLAKELASHGNLTVTGTFVGKVRYASPEQFGQIRAEPDLRSDLYSFGVVLYELLTGSCPIRGESFQEMIAAHLLHPIPDFDGTDPEGRVPTGVREAVLQALAKRPKDRPSSAEELSAFLRPFHTVPAPPFETVWESYASGARDRRAESAKAATTTLALPSAGPDGKMELVAATEPVTVRRAAAEGGRRRPGRWIAAALVMVLAAGLLWQWRTAPGPPGTERPATERTGLVVLDARPWAEVTAIFDAGGHAQPLSGRLYTPVTLALEPGRYQVTFEHPDLETPLIETVEVEAAQTVRQSADLGVLDADRYFETIALSAELRRAGS